MTRERALELATATLREQVYRDLDGRRYGGPMTAEMQIRVVAFAILAAIAEERATVTQADVEAAHREFDRLWEAFLAANPAPEGKVWIMFADHRMHLRTLTCEE